MPGLTIRAGARLALALAAAAAAGLALAPGAAAQAPRAAQPARAQQAPPRPRVLVFARTKGFRHGSIGVGKVALLKLGQKNGFDVDTTEDAGRFTDQGLAPYRAVIFLNTTGDVLDDAQQGAFERFIKGGRGFVGVHSATDTEYDWPWYGRLVGAYFESHPAIQQATFAVVDRKHPATAGLPAKWVRKDEFYNFKQIAPDLRVLITIDETSYQGGKNGANHPMAWYRELDGGRAFYTAMGHTDESYAEPRFLAHLLGGIRYAIGTAQAKAGKAAPATKAAAPARRPDQER